MNRRILVFLLFSLLGVLPGGGRASAQAPGGQKSPLFGRVLNAGGGPVAGVTVSLAHPTAGRSEPVTTGQDGAFSFAKVSSQATPYFVEAYRGSTLLYRQQVLYQGGSVQCDIRLP